jgi:hypothetical protein
MSQHLRAFSALIALCGLAACADSATGISPISPIATANASGGISGGGGGGGGGGGTQATSVAGNWAGTISTPFGDGAFSLRISVSGTSLSGSAHFGAPIFDSTLRLTGSLVSATQFTGLVSNGEGSLPLTGTLSADGSTLTGTVVQGATYTYVVTRQ